MSISEQSEGSSERVKAVTSKKVDLSTVFILSLLETLSVDEELGDAILRLLEVASKVDELSAVLILSLLETLLLDEELPDVNSTVLVPMHSSCCCELSCPLTGDGSFLLVDVSAWPLDVVVFCFIVGGIFGLIGV